MQSPVGGKLEQWGPPVVSVVRVYPVMGEQRTHDREVSGNRILVALVPCEGLGESL